ncbi:MAG TPA: carbohydrate ABC transporter permease [Candidatus Binatia bacterium]|nr:carbohydrate ABC transporter permease [Candidatus Binatia bacterium]
MTASGQAVAAPVGSQRGERTRRIIAYALLIGYALLMFVPFAWSVSTSFKPNSEVFQLNWIPEQPTLDGYVTAWTELDPGLPRLFLNSFIIAGAVTLGNLVLGSFAGYAFARLQFWGRDVLFVLVLATLMIPDQLRVVPVYNLLIFFGLVGRGVEAYIGIILILIISGTSIFLLRQYFMSIPRDLEEAARIDGAGYLQTFWRIMLPLASPALAAVAILQFQGTWNGFFWPVILLRDRDQWTIPLAIAQFQDLYQTQWAPLMAVIVLATLPILILYIFFQRYFVEGVAASGVKG